MCLQVNSLTDIEGRLPDAIQAGKEKLKEEVNVEAWNEFIAETLNPLLDLANNDLKDAARRSSAAKQRVKAQEKATQNDAPAEAAEGDVSSDDDESDDESA